MSKPQEILALEKAYRITLTETKDEKDIRSWGKTNLYLLNKKQEVVGLNLRGNGIKEIKNLETLTNLSTLNISENHISKIEHLETLTNLSELYISSNQISKIENLEMLTNLSRLYIYDNQISKIENLERLTNLSELYISSNQISKIENLEMLTNLSKLNISSNQISKIEHLETLTNLSTLYLSENQISKIENLERLTNLSELYISINQISKIEHLESLTNLSVLHISSNQISKIENLESLTNLSRLYIYNNQISKIENLETLTNLSELNISENRISKIENLETLTNLSELYISRNQISKIDILKGMLKLPQLQYLEVHQNPFVATENLILNYNENHLDTIKSELQKRVELEKDDAITIQFPVKVMLLGNHASGKSTLVTYFQTKKLAKVTPNTNTSTDILSVEHSKKIINYDLPKAIFYDFGGQDYYHGVYRAFFTQETVNLLVWHPKSNHNELLEKDSNNFATRNYKRSYWLAQLRYAFDKNNTNEATVYDDPVLLIQTRADEDKAKENWQQAFLQQNIVDEFHISLNAEQNSAKNKAILNYLTEAFWETVKKRTKEKKVPAWFPEFLEYIINAEEATAISIKDIEEKYRWKNIKTTEKRRNLKVELQQLSRKGMLLYYKEDEMLNDVAWLNPAATVEKIHETILNKEKIGVYKGRLTPKQFEDLEIDEKIEGLLINEKVLFFDKGNNEYIIPNYLPLTSEDDKVYNLLKFDYSEPTFVLKFERFIPFGFINQLICHYGQNPDKKQYWRDQLIFTLDGKFKIWIQLDFSKLTIKVYIRSKKPKDTQISKITQQIFREILFLYWDEKSYLINSKEIEYVLENLDEDFVNEPHKKRFKEFMDERYLNRELGKDSNPKTSSRTLYEKKLHIDFLKEGFKTLSKPDGLYLSTDNTYFVNYEKLDNPKTKETIPAYTLTKDKNDIDETTARTQSSYRYQNFTDNPNIQRMKKIFISYSRKDVEYKDELRKHLNMLKMFDVADNWSCEDITIGKWHDQIQKELHESDLVIFMLSINFFNSRYIIEEEVLNTMNEIANGSNKKVYCIIVSEFPSLNAFDNEKLNEKQKGILKLGDYQFGMYAQELNTVTGQKEERIISLKEASRLGILDIQLTKIAEKILPEIKPKI